MWQPKTEAFRVVLSKSEKAALERLAERDGGSQAAVLRRLLRREAEARGEWLVPRGASGGAAGGPIPAAHP